MAGWRCVILHLNDFTLTRIQIFYLEHGIGFQLRRWALKKMMSYVISANRLFMLTQSRLCYLLQGKFVVQVLSPQLRIAAIYLRRPHKWLWMPPWPEPSIVLRYGMTGPSLSLTPFCDCRPLETYS